MAGRTWIEDTVFRDSSATPLEVEPSGSLAVKNCTFSNIDRERIREMCMERAEDNFCELYPDGDFYVGKQFASLPAPSRPCLSGRSCPGGCRVQCQGCCIVR